MDTLSTLLQEQLQLIETQTKIACEKSAASRELEKVGETENLSAQVEVLTAQLLWQLKVFHFVAYTHKDKVRARAQAGV